jgi:hypothetical protein
MIRQPLRWQLALLYTILIGTGMVISFVLIPSSSVQYIFAHGVTLLASILAVVWILSSRRAIHLRRERRVWTLMTISVIAATLGHLIRIQNVFTGNTTQIPSWSDLAFSVSYAMVWIALLTRSGKSASDHLSRFILWWDMLIILWASSIISYHLALPGLGAFIVQPATIKAVSISYPVIGVLTLLIISTMLFRSVPRSLHGPRGLLVLGVMLVLGTDIASTFLMINGYSHYSIMFNTLGALGSLCYGISSLWEASFYSQRAVRARVIDPFPSVFGLVIPAVLILTALGVSIWSYLHNGINGVQGVALRTNIICLAILVGLVIVRKC